MRGLEEMRGNGFKRRRVDEEKWNQKEKRRWEMR